ncbi:signal peptidase complex catalytic subunit [Arthroderma uncinatum]|uniref:signal peptidase complex catalytic subunit n=1 Tax=Arthroderma uncinatum TaxID=74035 RepID=UPI00144A9895|nr:signal peptidase complex catalytic subunit [Arthroderma uncinatum]KAF3492266.1 signal peptidase complex catalytic subunit [Arthroderma uncinatum]
MASNATDYAITYACFDLPHLKRESMATFSAASSRFHTPRTSIDNGKRTMPSTPAMSRSNSKTRVSSPTPKSPSSKSSSSKNKKAAHAEATYLALR